MLQRTSNWLLKISSTWLMVASLLLMVLFMIFVLPAQAEGSAQASGSERSPDTSLFYSPEALYQMAEEYGPGGRQAYIQARWTFDLVFPLVYTSFLAVGISWFSQRLAGWKDIRMRANLLPLLGGLFDLLENTASSLVMAVYPAKIPIIPVAASFFTPVKWVLVGGSFLPYFIFGSAWLIQKLASKSRSARSDGK